MLRIISRWRRSLRVFPARIGRGSNRAWIETYGASWRFLRNTRQRPHFSFWAGSAEKYPHLVRQIAEAGHEIGSHGFGHQRLHCLTPTQFKEDIYRTRRLLEDLSGQRVTCYRAPSFSIVKSTLWALDVLVEEGFTCDSSVFPTRHDFYGIPDAPRFPHCRRTTQGHSILEFPPSTIRIFGNNIGVAGGGYLRLTPYLFTRRAMRRIIEKEKQPVMVYFHPWEIDPGQPRISASLRSRLRHYTNLAGMARKIEWLLKDFRFTTLSEVCKDLAIRDATIRF